jgi:hypothetical protein
MVFGGRAQIAGLSLAINVVAVVTGISGIIGQFHEVSKLF